MRTIDSVTSHAANVPHSLERLNDRQFVTGLRSCIDLGVIHQSVKLRLNGQQLQSQLRALSSIESSTVLGLERILKLFNG